MHVTRPGETPRTQLRRVRITDRFNEVSDGTPSGRSSSATYRQTLRRARNIPGFKDRLQELIYTDTPSPGISRAVPQQSEYEHVWLEQRERLHEPCTPLRTAESAPAPPIVHAASSDYARMWQRWRAIPALQQRLEALGPSDAESSGSAQAPSQEAAAFIEDLLRISEPELPPAGLSSPALSVLHARHVVDAAATLSPDLQCVICMQRLQVGTDEVVALPCGGSHAFHWHCVKPWLRRNSSCPQCRGVVKCTANH